MKSPTEKVLSFFDGVGHPIRARLLVAFDEVGRTSPNGLAEKLGIPLGTTAYHIRDLRSRKYLKFVGEKRVRGVVEHFYEITPAAKDLLDLLPKR